MWPSRSFTDHPSMTPGCSISASEKESTAEASSCRAWGPRRPAGGGAVDELVADAGDEPADDPFVHPRLDDDLLAGYLGQLLGDGLRLTLGQWYGGRHLPLGGAARRVRQLLERLRYLSRQGRAVAVRR